MKKKTVKWFVFVVLSAVWKLILFFFEMYRRVVNPPPKVIPKIEEINNPSIISNQGSNVIGPPQDEDFEALVQQEMNKLQQQFE